MIDLDIAPNYASILMGISNTFGTVPGIVSPLISGYIVHTPVSAIRWNNFCFRENAMRFECSRMNRSGKLFSTSRLVFTCSVAFFTGFSLQVNYNIGLFGRTTQKAKKLFRQIVRNEQEIGRNMRLFRLKTLNEKKNCFCLFVL